MIIKLEKRYMNRIAITNDYSKLDPKIDRWLKQTIHNKKMKDAYEVLCKKQELADNGSLSTNDMQLLQYGWSEFARIQRSFGKQKTSWV